MCVGWGHERGLRREVDAHHRPAGGRPVHLAEAGVSERGARSNVKLLVDHLRRSDRIRLDSVSPAIVCKADCRLRQYPAQSTTTEPDPGEHAGQRPDTRIGAILRAPFPRHLERAHQSDVGGTWLDGAPADRCVVLVSNEPTRCVRRRVPTVRLVAGAARRVPQLGRRRRTRPAPACSAGTDSGARDRVLRGSPVIPRTWTRSPARSVPDRPSSQPHRARPRPIAQLGWPSPR